MEMHKDYRTELEVFTDIQGFVSAALVDTQSGLPMATVSANADVDVELAAAANSEVVRAKLKAMLALDIDDEIEDILITMGTQYHLLRPLGNHQEVFIDLTLDREQTNLALARMKLKERGEALAF